MRINPINLYNSVKFSGSGKKTVSLPYYEGLNHDVFEKKSEKTSVINSRIKENSKRERVPFGVNHGLKRLGKSFIEDRIKEMSEEVKKAACESAFAGIKTKEYFDDKYGKNNYVIISMGTSPAGIAKGMEFMGVDVRYLPISNLDALFNKSFQDLPALCHSTGKYLEYLDSIGLNREEIEKDKREYILIDYTSSGDSLSTASDIARMYLGVKSPNFHSLSINDNIGNSDRLSKNETKRMGKYISKYMINSYMEDYCGIPHLSFQILDDIERLIESPKYTKETNFEIALLYYLENNKI